MIKIRGEKGIPTYYISFEYKSHERDWRQVSAVVYKKVIFICTSFYTLGIEGYKRGKGEGIR
jgi:hypothetical protein